MGYGDGDPDGVPNGVPKGVILRVSKTCTVGFCTFSGNPEIWVLAKLEIWGGEQI